MKARYLTSLIAMTFALGVAHANPVDANYILNSLDAESDYEDVYHMEKTSAERVNFSIAPSDKAEGDVADFWETFPTYD